MHPSGSGNADITSKTPVRLASDQIHSLPNITESEVFNTLRLLINSMDFYDEDGEGWRVLNELSRFRWERAI